MACTSTLLNAAFSYLTPETGRIWVSQTPPTLTLFSVPDPLHDFPRSRMLHLSSSGLPAFSQPGVLR